MRSPRVPRRACAPPVPQDPEKYTAHFASYLKGGVEPDDLEDLYTKVCGWVVLDCFC